MSAARAKWFLNSGRSFLADSAAAFAATHRVFDDTALWRVSILTTAMEEMSRSH